MSIDQMLDDLIDDSNANSATLDQIIAELQGGTISADTGDAPVYDEETGLWTCAQATANANGEYLGIYKLPLATLCSILDSLDIIAFTVPQPPNTPARLLPCGADPLTGWTNLPALVDLDGEEFNQFSIRSATPFEVRMKVAQSVTLCQDTNNFEYGTVVSVNVDPVAGTTTYVVNSGVVTGIHTMRWGFYATSAPSGCRVVSYGISPNWENDVYFRVVGEPGSTHHGPTNIGAVNLGEDGECFNLFQQNSPAAFQATIVFKHC